MIIIMPAAWATSIPVARSENALVAAVDLANSTSAKDTLTLASGCTYRMTSSHNGLTNALPVITTPIEMIGPATITRASLLPFRIAEVSSAGDLTLTTPVAFTNGSAVGNGGGILNRGAATLTGSSLSGSTATLNGGGLANAGIPSGTAPAATFTRSPVTLPGQSHVVTGGLRDAVHRTLLLPTHFVRMPVLSAMQPFTLPRPLLYSHGRYWYRGENVWGIGRGVAPY
ncbi:MAG TPA: hypothetical protein VGD53_20485 [Actinoallomurus sp.]|jgi:hypothetical protein